MTPRAQRSPAFGLFLIFLILAAFAGLAVRPDRAQALKPNQPAPEIAGGSEIAWINSAPLTMAGLKGRVVLVEFWTYG